MEYSKEQLDKMRTIAYDVIETGWKDDIIELLAYFDGEIYYFNKSYGTIHSYSTNMGFIGVVSLSDFEKEYYICNSNFGTGLNRIYKFKNEPIELLYAYCDKICELSIIMYVPSTNRIHVEYLKELYFELYFTRDYTKQNLNIIDEL